MSRSRKTRPTRTARSRRRSNAATTAWRPSRGLKPGVTIAQAQSDLSAIAANADETISRYEHPFRRRWSKPLREDMIGDVRTALYVLFGAVVCVLLIANANVANLLLARASVRGKEIALRAAMGASRARIIRQLLTESVLLSGLGGLLGLLFAQWGTEALIKTVPENIPRISDIQLDASVLVFHLARFARHRRHLRPRPGLAGVACRSQQLAQIRQPHRRRRRKQRPCPQRASSWRKSRSRSSCSFAPGF